MKWIKYNKNDESTWPTEQGRYFVRTNRPFLPDNNETKQVGTFAHREWYLENHHHSRDFFYFVPYEWLDESPSSLPDQGELYRWVKASERLPETGRHYILINGSFKRTDDFINGKFSKYGIEYSNDEIEWLCKAETPAANQDELWLSVKEIIMGHYNDYSYPFQAIKELSSKYHLIKK